MRFLDIHPLQITILYGTLNVLITLCLALNVSLHRLRKRTFAGDPVQPELHRKIRAHGNSAEYLAATTFLLAFLELQQAPAFWLHVFGGVIVLTRIVHSMAMLMVQAGRSRVRMFSATVTYVASFFMAIWSLVLRLR
jgi:uncharacterized membrane protein YecN with MAPEG domain